MNKTIELAEEHLLHTYNRFPVVLDYGKGVKLYDTDGKEYLDFYSGIGVHALGYDVEEYKDALKAQIDKIIHVSNLYYTDVCAEAACKLTKVAKMDRVFFTNSGAEAIEGALKTALKYAYNKDGKNDHEIVALDHSFHGRTCGALAVTGKAAYREAFEPLISKVNFANMNDLQSVTDAVNDKTCAIILETVQGEGGIYPATKEFIEGVYKLCKEKDILLILDEVQCGMGRTGYMYAWQQYDIVPDVVTSAKGLGNGVPVGAFMMTEKVAKNSLVAGDHGSTYGGNPLVCAAVSKVLDLFEEKKILENVNTVTPYLNKKLDELTAKHACVTAHRGMGFMQGLELTVKPGDVVNKCMDKGLLLLTAGTNVLRMLPPLVITNDDVDKMYAILDEVLTDMD
ncbi:MAG: aspartate aminotransferase family protein [Lachnospiraceae bacterium]|nr:aspartate aminotransferase family protein [Candidatus Colinaster equi]